MTDRAAHSSFKQLFYHYIGLLRRYELLVLIVIFIGTISGGMASFYMPTLYQARTILLMEREGITNPLNMKQGISVRLRDKLQTINEVVRSRQFLLRVIDRLNLDAGLTSNAEMEALVIGMRKSIGVRSRRGSYDIFEITYRNANPQRAQAINEIISNMFIEDNLEVVRRQQNASLAFVDDQLLLYKNKLEDSELHLREFKIANFGEMPGQQNAALSAIGRTQVELEKVRLALREARLQEVTLQKQLSGEKPMVVSRSTRQGSFIDGLKAKLANLLIHYTEKHPEVIKITSLIDRLGYKPQSELNSNPSAEAEVSTLNPVYQTLKEKHFEAARKIKTLEDQKKHYENKIRSYKEKVLAVPAKEQELIQIRRNYRVNNEIYQLLLKRLAEAQITRELDLTQRGERFTVLEPSTVPLFPIKPNRPKILVASLFLSCMLCTGVLILKDSLDDSLKTMDEVRAFLQVPVLAVIPELPSTKAIRRRRILRYTIITIGIGALIILGAFIAINDPRLLMQLPVLQSFKAKATALLHM
jgi:polysaccharide chain length determinant protein (PEP-CTERM system associated)